MSEKEMPRRVCSCGKEMIVKSGSGTGSLAPYTATCPKCGSWFDVYSEEKSK